MDIIRAEKQELWDIINIIAKCIECMKKLKFIIFKGSQFSLSFP